MKKPKTPDDVRGFRIRCVNFIQCPLCYGCRNYNIKDPECVECKNNNEKKNLCNIKLHRPDLISRMITYPTLKITDEQIEFESFK